MKLLVFAHVPPPHHGQSFAVKLMLESFGGSRRQRALTGAGPDRFGIECYHVNARYSKTLEDIGEFQGGKLFLILFYCLQALWCRFRHGVDVFYYVPAPGKSVALYRDWLVMLVCRPFFKKIIFHWHAAGLAKWLETSVSIRTRSLTYRRMRDAALSIVLSEFNRRDAEKMQSTHIRVVNNGIADPCPDFETAVLPLRRARAAERARILAGAKPAAPLDVNVFFLALCTREKGFFAAIEAVLCANRQLAARGVPLNLKLVTAGNFVNDGERAVFDHLRRNPEVVKAVRHAGFVSGDQKDTLLREADLFLFPTKYLGENQPINLIEAMAFGLPIVTTRWRSLPEMLPPDYPGLVADQKPEPLADALLALMAREDGRQLREHYLRRFTLEQHLTDLAAAIRSVEE